MGSVGWATASFSPACVVVLVCVLMLQLVRAHQMQRSLGSEG